MINILKQGAAIAIFAGAFLVAPIPASAQQLSKGDFELCTVYNRHGEHAGFDSVCLAHKRAALRYFGETGETFAYRCPRWANNGSGYNATFYRDGRAPSYFGTYDSTLNGRPCVPFSLHTVGGYW